MAIVADKKVIAICQSGGEFATNINGSLFYIGGEAYAIDIGLQTSLADFKSEVVEIFCSSIENMLIKYLLLGNKKTLITIAKDKDFKRMINFLGDAPTTDIYIMTEEAAARNISNMLCSRSTRTTVSEVEVPAVMTVVVADALDYMTNEIVDIEIPNDVTPLVECG